MFLPEDYPEDFAHAGLREAWFIGVPWHIQSRIMSVDTRCRVIRNPVSGVFVIVLQLGANDPDRIYPFFGTAQLDGWKPLLETEKGLPVQAVLRLAEGMEASARVFDAEYGTDPQQIAANYARKAVEREMAKDAKMAANTRFTSDFTRDFLLGTGSSMRQGMSPRRRAAMFRGAEAEFLSARIAREEAERQAESGGSRIIVP